MRTLARTIVQSKGLIGARGSTSKRALSHGSWLEVSYPHHVELIRIFEGLCDMAAWLPPPNKKAQSHNAFYNLSSEVTLCYFYNILLYTMMVNFICQHDWAIGCPNIWSNIILSLFCKGVFG